MRARGEAIRSRKKMESDLNDLEVQVQHSKRLADESQKQTKTLSSQLKEAVVNHDDCCRVTEDLKEQSQVKIKSIVQPI